MFIGHFTIVQITSFHILWQSIHFSSATIPICKASGSIHIVRTSYALNGESEFFLCMLCVTWGGGLKIWLFAYVLCGWSLSWKQFNCTNRTAIQQFCPINIQFAGLLNGAIWQSLDHFVILISSCVFAVE